MVTDEHTYIGTSNWSADYFLSTGGASWILSSTQARDQVQAIFDRDWSSQYAHPLSCHQAL